MNEQIFRYLESSAQCVPSDEAEAERCAEDLGRISATAVYPRSIIALQKSIFFLCRRQNQKLLAILGSGTMPREDFQGGVMRLSDSGHDLVLTFCPTNARNARALRGRFAHLTPAPLGLRGSVGCGDRLGMATPGHVRAVRKHGMAPILAQQSVRENARTGRNPQQVMDEALWGIFQEGWRGGFGADADHLKTAEDVDSFAEAGYTFFTFDPGEHVNNAANSAPVADLEAMAAALPWDVLESSLADVISRLARRNIDLGTEHIQLERVDILRAAAKYGSTVAHTIGLYRHLSSAAGDRPFEVEMSVDETETVTSLAEHIYIAGELRRLGMRWVSLAPRYVGTFEKGVDYIGNLDRFETSFSSHMRVARAFGPYKLSLHSGSDKFSIYPIAARLAWPLVHLKTAGTSYLEALRTLAGADASLFRDLVAFCKERYPADRASYHVSAEVARMKDAPGCPDDELPSLLNDFHTREILHVTFGSVLKNPEMRDSLYTVLADNEESYYRLLETHFDKHLSPFRG